MKERIEELENKIKELEQINEEHRKLNGELREENNTLRIHLKAYKKDSDETQDRINKAIEYVKKNRYYDGYAHWLIDDDDNKLLDILQGSEDK